MAQFGSTDIDALSATIASLNTAVNTLKNTDVASLSSQITAMGTNMVEGKTLNVKHNLVSSAQPYLVASISGAGVLKSIRNNNLASYFKVVIDGVQFTNGVFFIRDYRELDFDTLKFNTSLAVHMYENWANQVELVYALN